MERTAAEPTPSTSVGLSVEDRITRDMLKVIADLSIEEDDQRLHRCGSSTRWADRRRSCRS